MVNPPSHHLFHNFSTLASGILGFMLIGAGGNTSSITHRSLPGRMGVAEEAWGILAKGNSRLDQPGPARTSLDQPGPAWTNMNQPGPAWTSLDHLNQLGPANSHLGPHTTSCQKTSRIHNELDETKS